jgi:hypothetical protein
MTKGRRVVRVKLDPKYWEVIYPTGEILPPRSRGEASNLLPRSTLR